MPDVEMVEAGEWGKFFRTLALELLETPFIVLCSFGAALLVWLMLFPLSLVVTPVYPQAVGVLLGLVGGGYMVFMLQARKKRGPFWWLA